MVTAERICFHGTRIIVEFGGGWVGGRVTHTQRLNNKKVNDERRC